MRLFSSSSLSVIMVVPSAYLRLLIFNLYAEYITRNTGLEEEQAEVKIPGRNINNHRYADDTTLMAESKEVLKSLDESERRE